MQIGLLAYGRSADNRRAVPPRSVARQLRIVQRGDGIDAIVFWSGWQTEHEMASAREPVEPIALDDFSPQHRLDDLAGVLVSE